MRVLARLLVPPPLVCVRALACLYARVRVCVRPRPCARACVCTRARACVCMCPRASYVFACACGSPFMCVRARMCAGVRACFCVGCACGAFLRACLCAYMYIGASAHWACNVMYVCICIYSRTHVIRILRGPRNLFELHDYSNYRSFHT